jgi:ribosomal-protein-serine acetyltransferase
MIAGEDVELRSVADEDTIPLRLLIDRHRNYLREWLPWVDQSRSLDDVRAFIRGSMQQAAENNGFSTVILNGGKIAGVLGVHQISWLDRATSIGYWLAPEFQGRGIVTRACSAVLAHLFQDLGLHRVEIRCASGNRKSCAIAERLGFRHEGILRDCQWINDRFHDLNVYGLLSHEFKLREGDCR